MPIEAVVSSSPCLDFEAATLPLMGRRWLDELTANGNHKWWWVVPTSRRRRQMIRQVASAERPSILLPRIHTFESLRQQMSGYSLVRERILGNTGRLIRVAKAWRSVTSNESQITLGQVLQLDRIAQDWRSANRLPPSDHPHFLFIKEFERLLRVDRCQDVPGQLASLAGELDLPNSPLGRMVGANTNGIIFDGFHSFSEAELQLIASLARHALVRLWLVGPPGSTFHASVQAAFERLRVDHFEVDTRVSQNSMSAIGRTLFRGEARPQHSNVVELFESPSEQDEIEASVRLVKSIARAWGDGSRLADIAMVVPDSGYLARLIAALTAAGIAYSAAAESFSLADSRPCRLLLTALQLVRHDWPAAALFDFLRQPIISRRLKDCDRLEWLRDRAPRNAFKFQFDDWKAHWNALRERSKPEIGHLIDLICEILEPVAELQAALNQASQTPAKLIAACAKLVQRVGAAEWLSPTGEQSSRIVPLREWEIDQLAFANLKDVLEELASIPVEDFPRAADGSVDLEFALRLALAAESFRIGADDDAGVQILRPAAIRGSRFRVVMALGLTEGKAPSEGGNDLAPMDAASLPARRQRERRWDEQYLFTQLFESATERLILTRPLRDGDVELIESPFLRELRRSGASPRPVAAPDIAIDSSRAAEAGANSNPSIVVGAWQESRKTPPAIRDWALPLLMRRYPAERNFSATELESYAACPFQHFATRTLSLRQIERDATFLDAGSFVHKLLKRFFEELRNEFHIAEGTPLPEIPIERARANFAKLFREQWQENGGENDPTLRHDFEKALGEVLLLVTARLQSQGFTQVAAEWSFQDVEIGVDDGGHPVRLRGSIDRIDRDAAGRELVGDYKSGALPGGSRLTERVRNGRLIQLPLYAAVREQVTHGDVCHGIYLRLSRQVESDPSRPDDFLTHIGEALEQGKKMQAKFVPRAGVALALRFASAIRAGRIELTEFDAESNDPACVAHCVARHACRHPKGYS